MFPDDAVEVLLSNMDSNNDGKAAGIKVIPASYSGISMGFPSISYYMKLLLFYYILYY